MHKLVCSHEEAPCEQPIRLAADRDDAVHRRQRCAGPAADAPNADCFASSRQVGLSAARLRQACAAAADRRYLLCRRGRGRGGHVDVVLARDADDADVTEAFAAALFTCGTVPLPAGQVWSCHPSTLNDRAADRNRAATNSEFCLRHESGERAEVACGLAGLDHQQNVAETKGSCEVQWDNKADPAQAWLQLHWAAFVKQLGVRGWVLCKPRFAVQRHRATWQFPDRPHED